MQNALIISIFINLLCILLGGYFIHRKGGLTFLKKKLNLVSGFPIPHDYGAYYKAKKSIFEIMPIQANQIIFLGDSITNYCNWHELFGKANIKNRGIDGDIINGVIKRLDEIVKSKPKKIFLMVGINDLEEKNSVKQILIDYEGLISAIQQASSETELFIQSILPTDNSKHLQIVDILEINNGLEHLAEKYNLTYINLFDLLKTKENTLNVAYTFDGVHLNGEGYLVWKKEIETYIN